MTERLQEPPNDKRSWLSAAEAEAYYAPKSYDRGNVDWRERTKPPFPSTPEQLAIRLPPVEPEPPKVKPEVELLLTAQEDSVETIIKRTKTGAINTQSTVGKVVSLASEKGCELKVGNVWTAKGDDPYERNLWLQGAHHGLRFTVSGATVVMNGRLVPAKDLLVRLEEIDA